MAGATTIRANQNEPLDALVWRATGRGAGVVEAVLAANPGLALVAQALPEGRAVIIPGDALAPATQPLVQLWD